MVTAGTSSLFPARTKLGCQEPRGGSALLVRLLGELGPHHLDAGQARRDTCHRARLCWRGRMCRAKAKGEGKYKGRAPMAESSSERTSNDIAHKLRSNRARTNDLVLHKRPCE